MFVWESDGKELCPKLNCEFVNQNVKILGRRLCSPSLEDVAWLEDALLIFLILHLFVYKIWLARGTSRRTSSRAESTVV